MKRTFRFGLAATTTALVALATWTVGLQDIRAPSPAVLTAGLGGSVGATATSRMLDDGSTETAYRFPTTLVTCSATVPVSNPCTAGTTPLASGTTIFGTVYKGFMSGVWKCRCVL